MAATILVLWFSDVVNGQRIEEMFMKFKFLASALKIALLLYLSQALAHIQSGKLRFFYQCLSN